MEKILILDNYDSFTYNLVHYFEELSDGEITVKRNDQITLEEVNQYDTLVFSPGPGLPEDAGLMLEIIKTYATKKKILGVCLGHQAIGMAFGAKLSNLKRVFHGIKSKINIFSTKKIFLNISENTEVGRYHSWVIEPNSFPNDFEITSKSDDGAIMSMAHKKYPIFGLQFHPESIMTKEGKKMIANFLKIKQ